MSETESVATYYSYTLKSFVTKCAKELSILKPIDHRRHSCLHTPESYLATYVYTYAKQKHLGCKKVRGQSEAILQTGRCDQKV